MIIYESQCVGCPQGCMNCGAKHTAVLICDDCGAEEQELYVGEDEGQYCKRCVLDHIEKVRVEE